MRDGLHKDLPLGRAWQGVVKSCEREAERGETTRSRVEHALAVDARQEVSQSFVRQFVQTAERATALLPTFNAFDSNATPRELHGTNSPLENEILANAKRLERDGLRGRLLAQRAVEQALRDRGESRVRQIEQHCRADGAAAVSRAAGEAIRVVDLSSIVEPLLRNESPSLAPAKRPVDLDEDLTKPR